MRSTPESRALAVAMKNRGGALRDVARILNVSTRTVQRWIDRYYQENPEQPKPRRFQRSTPEERHRAYELRKSGTTTAHIAKINNVSSFTIKKWVAKHRETLNSQGKNHG
jgi:transposase-like protein